MSSKQKLLAEIEAFLKRTGMTENAFGMWARNEGKFIARLRSGKGCTLDSADYVRKCMREFKSPKRASGKRRPSSRPQQAA